MHHERHIFGDHDDGHVLEHPSPCCPFEGLQSPEEQELLRRMGVFPRPEFERILREWPKFLRE